MEPVVYKSSAFKHGVTVEQIAWVLDNPRYEGPVELYENKHIVLGFDRAGNLLEIGRKSYGFSSRSFAERNSTHFIVWSLA